MIRRFLKANSDPDSDNSDADDSLEPFAYDYTQKPFPRETVFRSFDDLALKFFNLLYSIEDFDIGKARLTLDIETEGGKIVILTRTF